MGQMTIWHTKSQRVSVCS